MKDDATDRVPDTIDPEVIKRLFKSKKTDRERYVSSCRLDGTAEDRLIIEFNELLPHDQRNLMTDRLITEHSEYVRGAIWQQDHRIRITLNRKQGCDARIDVPNIASRIFAELYEVR